VTIEYLPAERQPRSDMQDMRTLLKEFAGEADEKLYLPEARARIEGRNLGSNDAGALILLPRDPSLSH
jgi:hypothetical protein